MNATDIIAAADKGVKVNNSEDLQPMQTVTEGVGFSQESTYEEPQDAPNLLTASKAQEHARIMGQVHPSQHWGQSGTTLYNPLRSHPAVEKKFGKEVYTEAEVAGGLNEHQRKIGELAAQVEQLTKILAGNRAVAGNTEMFKTTERNIAQLKTLSEPKKVIHKRGNRKKAN